MKAILLESPELDVYGQMALDEALFSVASARQIILRFYRWPEEFMRDRWGAPLYGVTFGYFQSYETAREEARKYGNPHALLTRRLTGGGIVFHNGDITFSLVFPWDSSWTPSLIYRDLHRGVHLGLKAQGLRSRLWSPPSAHTRRPYGHTVCFTEPSPIDLVHENGKKFLGGALRKRRGIGLYQGSLRPEGFEVPADRLVASVVEGISMEWKTVFRPQVVDAALIKQAQRLRAEKYMSQEWNMRRGFSDSF